MIQHTVPGNLSPLGYEQVTSLSAAAALTVPSGARVAMVQAETQNVRWRDDGDDPTGTVGMLLVADDRATLMVGSLNALRFIETAASAVLNVTYYG